MEHFRFSKKRLVINADCFDVLGRLGENSIDLIIIDPPYCTTNKKWDQIDIVNSRLVELLFRVLKPTGNIYVWCGIGEKSQSLIRWFPLFKEIFHFKDQITWMKSKGIGMRKGWLYTREEILWFVKDNKRFQWNKSHQYSKQKRTFTASYADKERHEKYKKSVKSEFKRWTNVWTDIREERIVWNDKSLIKTTHYTPKPLKALRRIIECHTNPGMKVLDCVSGSGQTALASIQTKRNFVLIEKDGPIYRESITRIKDMLRRHGD